MKYILNYVLFVLLFRVAKGQEAAEDAATEVPVADPDNKGISVEGQAFLLVIAAGLCTAIGASVVFFPVLANLAKPSILSLALSFAAGIMLYISLIDIYGKSVEGYAEDFDDGDASVYAALTFFGGAIIMLLVDVGVDALLKWDNERAAANGGANVIQASLMGSTAENGAGLDKMREDFIEKTESERNTGAVEQPTIDAAMASGNGSTDIEKSTAEAKDAAPIDATDGNSELNHMGWAMAAAIAIHNFPEGMVTYLAYVQDNAVGVALAIGIAIHNVPEGLCVAMPLYYATGRRFYSFAWGTLSGLTEPLGALIVWGVLYNGLSGTTNGILFGIVSGMMTVISIDELLPTAHKYATNPRHVTYMVLFGMLFIASSLMLFEV